MNALTFTLELIYNTIKPGTAKSTCRVISTELTKDIDLDLLNIPGYRLEVENSEVKSRVAMYIKNTVRYERCLSLEGENNHLLIIDVMSKNNRKRLINIYRSFNPHGLTAREGFIRQLDKIKLAFKQDSVLLGDLNLDFNKKFDFN